MRKQKKLNLYRIKSTTKRTSIKLKILEIHKNTLHKKIIRNQLFPTTESAPLFIFNTNSNSLEFELEWILELISLYKSSIRDFLLLKEEYTQSYFNSQYHDCKLILDVIEDKFGINIWLIENRINLLNLIDDSAKSSEQYFDFMMNSKINNHYKILSWILYLKSEDMVSPARFEIELERIASSWKAVKNHNLHDYIQFHFSIAAEFEDLNLNSILNVQENLSIIDRYFTLVSIVENIIDSPSYHLNQSLLEKSYQTVNNISNSQFSPYFKIMNKDTNLEENEVALLSTKALDCYSLGNYTETISICERILLTKSYEIEIYELYIKSLLICEVFELKNDEDIFYKNIINLFLKTSHTQNKSDSESIIDTILKICTEHNSNEWAWKLLSLCATYKYGNNILDSIPAFKKGYKYSHFLKPQIISNLFSTEDDRNLYIASIFTENSITRKVHEAYSSLNIELIKTLDIERNRKLRLIGNLYLLKECYRKSLESFNLIDQKNSYIYEAEITIGKVKCYLGLNELEITIDLIVKSYFNGNDISLEIDTTQIYNRLLGMTYNHSNINILIFIELFTRYSDPSIPVKKHDFLEDFLIANNINLISELDLSQNIYPENNLIFLLKEYCTVDNMAKYYYFESQEKVEEERISICRLLTQIDYENITSYNDEIKEITKRMQIRAFTAALEKSKIYVDIEGIKKQSIVKIEDNFHRILEYFSSARNKGELMVFTLEEKIENNSTRFKGNRYSDMYNDIIFQLRDTFISSKEYGLDVYLSLGIRHGTIFAQLRKLFEKEYFMTLFVSSLNQYKTNYYWLEKMNISDLHIERQVNEVFQNFNKKIDSLLLYLKDYKLQITTNSDDKIALFNYYIPSFELLILFSIDSNNANLTIDTFIDKTLDKLWEITEVNLERVRNYLTGEFKGLLLNEINTFVQKINEINSDSNNVLNLQEYNQKVIDLRTELEYQIKNVSNWFTKENIIEIDNFPIELPINIALEFIKSLNLNSKINSNIRTEKADLKIDGKYLKWFSELFITIFDNVLKRSGFRKSFEIMLDAYINKNGKLTILCKNPLNIETDEINQRREELSKKLEEIEYISNHEESNLISRASIEGGSGLYKIVKLLKYDIKSEFPKLDFGIDDEEFFFIEITLNTGGFTVVNSDS